MHHVHGLTSLVDQVRGWILLLLCALCASSSALGATCQQSYQKVGQPAGGSYATSDQALNACTLALGKYKTGTWGTNYSDTRDWTYCKLATASKRYEATSYLSTHIGTASGVCVTSTSSVPTQGNSYNYTTLNTGPTTEECNALNDPPNGPPRDKISYAESAPASYCNDGGGGLPSCMLTVNPTAYKSEPGTLPDGTPVTWKFYEQRYSGASCNDSPTAPHASDLSGTETGAPGGDGWQCNQAAGTCFDPSGRGFYCTFTTTGARSSCVEMNNDGDGDGVTDPVDTYPDDPSNGGDDGNGNEADNESSGGATCGSPPVSTGDGIAAQIAYQTWATRCAVENLEITGGSGGTNTGTPGAPGGEDCSASLTCTGMSTADCFAFALHKRQACAGESMVDGIGDMNEHLAEIAAKKELDGGCQAGDTACEAALSLVGTAVREDAWRDGAADGEGDGDSGWMDTSGWLLNRACPQPPNVNFFGTEVHFDISIFCDFLNIGAGLVLVFATMAAARIVGTAT